MRVYVLMADRADLAARRLMGRQDLTCQRISHVCSCPLVCALALAVLGPLLEPVSTSTSSSR